MNNNFFTDIRVIRNAIDTKRLVVFAGAGISIDAGIPGWGTLINEMKADINIPINENDYLRIAQMYFNDRQQKEYIDKIRTVLKHNKVRYNAIHEEIFNLDPEHILTTNYDNLLDQVIKARSLPFSVISRDHDFPYALNTKHLVKIHGDLSNTDIVLKEDDYIDYSLKHPLIEGFIKSMFVSKVVLFIGYGFSDINLKMIMQTVRSVLDDDFQNAYLLNIDKDFHPVQRDYLKKKGVRVINYYDTFNSDNEDYITEYLKEKNALNQNYYKECGDLSSQGQTLLNFIRFIVNYDKFNEAVSGKHIIDQMFDSLARFNEFKSLPPDFIANLYPFNNAADYVHHYENYSLLTKNDRLHDLFFNHVSYLENELVYTPPDSLGLTKEQTDYYQDKLKQIIKVLNFGMIFHIFKENDAPDSFGYKGWSDKSQKLYVKHPEKCDCLTCCYNRLDLANVISGTLTDTVSESSDIKNDFEIAYSNYSLGNFLVSFSQFEEIANKAWEAGKYFSYYIAKHNSKTLRNLISFYERTIRSEEKEEILKEIENIDFDKLLFQIPYMGEDEYRLLKMIRDDDVLKGAKKELSNILKKVKETYEIYQNNGTSMGTYYPKLIRQELWKIKSFYTQNHIVADAFIEYREACNIALEASLICYAIDDSYHERLKEFDALFFEIFTLYGNASELKKISERYKIDTLVFSNDAIPKIIEVTNNYLKSFVSEYMFWGNARANDSTAQQLKNYYFEKKSQEEFNNIFLQLSGVVIDKNIAGQLIENIISFLNAEDFIYSKNLEYLSAFIYKNYHLFTRENCEAILKGPIKRYGVDKSEDLFRALAYVYEKNDFERSDNKDLMLKHIYTKHHNNLFLIDLWRIANEEIKPLIKERIIKLLNETFNEYLYLNSVSRGILSYHEYFNGYITGIAHSVSGEAEIDSNRIFINALSFIYKMKIETHEYFDLFKNKTEYMAFYLDPENYDYSVFKSEWMLTWDIPNIYERLGKISALKIEIEKALREKFNPKLAEIYFKYFRNM